MNEAARDIGAVVLGGDYVGLGIVRSLGARGVPVAVVDDERSIARFSRYATQAVRVASISGGEPTVDVLLELAERRGLGGWVLLPTRDEAAATLSCHRGRLAERFRVPTPPWETFRWAWDKRLTYELAARVGIPAPRTWHPAGRAQLEAIDAEPPYVIKPAIKPRFLQATKKKAWRVDSRQELARRFEDATAIAGGDGVMVQELIPGFGERQFAYCTLFKGGRALAGMTARRVRQHPMSFGRASTFVETVELPELEACSARFLREIDFHGLVELEYKHDPRTAEYKLLDVNARHWGYHALGAQAGVDFSYLVYADQVGLPLAGAGRARAGVTWMRALTDAPTAALEIRAGRLDLSTYLCELRSRDVEAVFSLTDARPGLAELALLPYLAVQRGF